MATQDVLQNLDAKMAKSVDALKVDLAGIRAGRANPSLLSKVMVCRCISSHYSVTAYIAKSVYCFGNDNVVDFTNLGSCS